MKTAKTTGPAAYHRHIKDLNQYGCKSCGQKKTAARKALFIFLLKAELLFFGQ